MLIAAVAGILALLVCAALVVQISYRPDGWPGVYADTLHGGFRGPYGSYPAAPLTGLPTAYRSGGISYADRSYLFDGLRIDVARTDVTAIRVGTGTRYWQYHRKTASRVVAVATDVVRGDLFLAWQAADEPVVRLERVDVRAGRLRWHEEVRADGLRQQQDVQAGPLRGRGEVRADGLRRPEDMQGGGLRGQWDVRADGSRRPEDVRSGPGYAKVGAPLVVPGADPSGQVTVFVWGAEVVGFDRADGRRRWSTALGCSAGGGAAAESGIVVIGLGCTGEQAAAGIDAMTGGQRWVTHQVSGDGATLVALGGGRVVVSSLREGPLLDVATGRVVAALPGWDPGIVVDETTKRRFLLLHGTRPTMGVGDIGSAAWQAEVPLPAEAAGGRLVEVQSGSALVAAATGLMTLIPSTAQSIAK